MAILLSKMKKKIFLLGGCSFACILLMYVLHTICIEQNLKIGNFKRTLTIDNLIKIEEIDIPYNVYNFAGVTDKNILFTSEKLNGIIKYNISKKKFYKNDFNHRNHNSNIVGNSIYSFDPFVKKMFIYDINTFGLLNTIDLDVPFDRAIALNDETVLLRSSTDKYTKTILSYFDIKSKTTSKLKIQLSDSLEVDGGLGTDGYFTYKDSKILYTQYKKGSFYKISKNLKNIERFSTIDNNQIVDGLAKLPDSTFYFEKPVLNSNLLTTINKDKVYVISFVKGNSDKLNEFTKRRMVDVYALADGKYINSFYLPNNGIEKVNDFYIDKNKIYLLYNKKISIYELK
jgi:hypothetical protein